MNKFHRPRVKVCPECKAEFWTSSSHQIFCSRKCFGKDWRRRHHEFALRKTREWKRKVDVLWGSVGKLADNHPRVVESEEYVAKEVLPKEGFTDIVLTRSFDRGFPIDVFGRKNDVWYGFDVSLAFYKKLKPEKTRLLEHLGIRTMVVFVKPDRTLYFIKEYNASKTHISCVRDFRTAVKV